MTIETITNPQQDVLNLNTEDTNSLSVTNLADFTAPIHLGGYHPPGIATIKLTANGTDNLPSLDTEPVEKINLDVESPKVNYPHITKYQYTLNREVTRTVAGYKTSLHHILDRVLPKGSVVIHDNFTELTNALDIKKTLIGLVTFTVIDQYGKVKKDVLVLSIRHDGILGLHGVVRGPSSDELFGLGLACSPYQPGDSIEFYINGDETNYMFTLTPSEDKLLPKDNQLFITKGQAIVNYLKDSELTIQYTPILETTKEEQTMTTTTTPVKDDQSIEALDVLINQRLDTIASNEIPSLIDSKKKALDQITSLETELKELQDALEVIDKKKKNVLMEFMHLKDLKATRESKV